MSINTSNLVTTRTGQIELSKVHSMNMRLKADKRSISVELLFPYLAISDKDMQAAAAGEEETDLEIKNELCWTNVDVCQVVNYSVGDEAKRNFTIGGLFNVENDITGAKSFLLFFKTNIVDFRSEAEKQADGGASAEYVLYTRYGYSVKQAPFAFTMILNNAGEMPEDGISIGASKFGRSRHRFYFNYIIDNNSGIADNITVNDNRYPYSDGYLSKTAFEDGLKRYEKAIAQYQAEYEKYANGHKLYYNNLASAMKYANPTHNFLIKDLEYDNADFPNVDLLASNDITGWDEWPGEAYVYEDSYDGYTAPQYGTPYGEDSDRAAIDRALPFEYKDVRRVEFELEDGTKEIKCCPVKFSFMFFLRSSLPSGYGGKGRDFQAHLSYISMYHVCRCWATIIGETGETIYNNGFEMVYKDDSKAFAPSCPSVGKIKVKNNGDINISLLTEEVRINFNQLLPNTNTYKGVAVFKLLEIGEESTTLTDSAVFELGQEYSEGNSETDAEGTLKIVMQPNFSGGYVFSTFTKTQNSEPPIGTASIYEFPKEFDCEDSVKFITGSVTKYEVQSGDFAPKSTAIVDNVVVAKDDIKEINYVLKDNSVIDSSKFSELVVISSLYRLVGDFRLQNARVFVTDNAVTSNYMHISPSTELKVAAYINNYLYRLDLTYGDLFPNFAYISSISKLEVLNVNCAAPVLQNQLGVTWRVHYKDEGNIWKFQDFTSLTVSNAVKKYVAIEDCNGDVNIIEGVIK